MKLPSATSSPQRLSRDEISPRRRAARWTVGVSLALAALTFLFSLFPSKDDSSPEVASALTPTRDEILYNIGYLLLLVALIYVILLLVFALKSRRKGTE